MTEQEIETSEALLSLIRFGYNEAISELQDFLEDEDSSRFFSIKNKLIEMQNTKKTLNYDLLKQELDV